MLIFHPAIARNSSLLELPHPILVFRIRDAWDFEKMKVPLRDGDQLAGHSREGTEIAIEGQIGQHSGNLKLTEPDMLATLEVMREALTVNETVGSFSLVLFEDATNNDHRYFKSCTTTRFEFDLSNQHLYSFNVMIHAADPHLYSGALPG